ncbi:Forkhead box protein J3 [Lachnellula suecica]|uniref:Forkhead box protein J3 n=1 Tax=Lachnellula suecica TaxID=602035 RepID=A0A8T9CBU1_9HELO|nr:Forkhead box protein J3 [Lachnellula suecica]
MNSGHYRRRPQINGLPLNYQYAESSGAPMQSTQRMFSFDSLPRAQNDQQFMMSPSTVTNMPSNNYSLTTPMALPQPPTSVWSDPNHRPMSFDDQTAGDYYGYSPSIAGMDQGNGLGMNYSDVPRTCFPCDPRMLNDGSLAGDSFEPSAYLIDPKNSMPTSPGLGFENVENSHSFSRLSISPQGRSPKLKDETPAPDNFRFRKPTPFALPSCEPSEDGRESSRETTAVDGDDPSADEPYAKLIYRALMSAPNHSMVLQEIYEWFRQNTAKGSSDSKGWMNSIRHNLSMNAAFKKTERKLIGDETKKSTEWVLEGFAIKDGVQSTTRYRKGTGAKKFTRSDNPTLSRQSSGRKGGISAAASKTKLQRHHRDRSERRRSIQRQDILHSHSHAHFPPQMRAHTPRQSSPLTPPNHERMPASCAPYYFGKVEPQLEIQYEEEMCGLEGVQGVYIDDGGPLFTHNQNGQYAGDGLPRY